MYAMKPSVMRRIIDAELAFVVSPDLDIMGFYEISHEIVADHPLYAQLVGALTRINISIPSTGLGNLKKEELQKQVNEFYVEHLLEIKEHCEQTYEQWNKCENSFLHTCDELFSNKAFIEVAEFTAYPTLWKVYIQQMKQHAISFPLVADMHDKDEAIYIVMHELLHTFFYQYAETVPSLRSRDDLWDIAEIFNSIVLNQMRFRIFYPSHTITIYPTHSNILKEITASGVSENDCVELIITQISNHLKPQESTSLPTFH